MSATVATVLAENHSKGALNSHEMSQKKQLPVEVQQMSSILENCISQVEIVAALPAILRLNSMSTVVDMELSKALQEHQTLEEKLEILEALKQDSDGEQKGEDGTARKAARAQLEDDIKNSVRNLLRFFRGHRDTFLLLKSEIGMEVGESECKLITGLKVFHSHMVEKLLSSPNEEQPVFYKHVSSSLCHNLEHTVLKEEQLDAAMKEIDGLISQEKAKIKKLQNSLQEKNTQDLELSTLPDQQSQPHIKTSKKLAIIQQKTDQLNVQLKNLIIENREAERMLQEKNEKVENKIEYMLHLFDSEMEEIQRELERNERENEKEDEELRRMEIPFSVLKVECDQILERRWLAEEKRKEEMMVLELKTKAAIFAQAWWRGYSVRKTLKNKGKGKKDKKGKGKKKK